MTTVGQVITRECSIPPTSTGGRSKQRLLLASGVVALLLVAHVTLMASERHATVMTPLHEQFSATLPMPVAAHVAAHAAFQSPAPAPFHLIGDCPGQAAVVPLLLLLLALAGMKIGAGRTLRLAVTSSLGFRSPIPVLPPVAAHRRRALLQVYLN